MITYDDVIDMEKRLKLEIKRNKKMLHKYLKDLRREDVITVKERRVLAYRLDGFTLHEVGDILIKTKYSSGERIRQIEAKAREKIRQHESQK